MAWGCEEDAAASVATRARTTDRRETHNTVTDAPAFQGAVSIATARQVYGIRNPEDKQLALF